MSRSDFFGDVAVANYIDSLRRNVSSSPDYESWEYTPSPFFNRQTDDWTTYPVKERIFAGIMADPALKAQFASMYDAPGRSTTGQGYYDTATRESQGGGFMDDFGDILKFAGMAGGLALGGSALFGDGGLSGLFGGGGLSDAAMVGESLGSVGGASSAAGAAGGGMDFLNSLNVDPFGAGGSSWFENLATPDWASGMVDSVAPAVGGWGSNVASASSGLEALFRNLGIDPSKIAGNVGGSLLRSLFTGAGGANSGSYSFPFADVLKGLMEYSGQKDYQGELMRLMDKSIEYSDPFRSQRPRYFEPLYDAATKGIGGTPYGDSIANSTLRKLSSTGDAGYDISGLGANTLAKNLNSASMDYVKNIAPLAGAQFGGNASQSITSMGPAAAGAGLSAQGGLGAAFEAANRGSQPSALEQLFGQQKNQNLGQALFSF